MSSSLPDAPLPPQVIPDSNTLVALLIALAVSAIIAIPIFICLHLLQETVYNNIINGRVHTNCVASITFEYKPRDDNGIESCAICLEDYKVDDECRAIIRCKHVYHKPCIDSWLTGDNHCPLCHGSIHGGSIRIPGLGA